MKFAIASVVIGLSLATSAFAQDERARAQIREALDGLNTTAAEHPGLQANQILGVGTWQGVDSGILGEDVKSYLANAGWDPITIDPGIEATETYDLFRKTMAPGVQDYLAVPSVGDPVQFEAVMAPGSLVRAGYFGVPDSKQLREELLDQLASAIEALCSMRARPTIIKASASAFGVVSVEGTWEADKICPNAE